MTVVDLTNIDERRKAVYYGYIWSAPRGAILKSIEDIKAGLIPAPDLRGIPAEWRAMLEDVEPGEDVRAP